MNLFDSPIFPVRTQGKVHYMTLQEMLRSTGVAQIDHPSGFLSTPLRMLASALVQALAAQSDEIDEQAWKHAVAGDAAELGKIADQLFHPEVLTRAKRGFDVFGESAFMQSPAALFADQEPEAIEGLFQPFRLRREGTGKALRSETHGIKAVCPCCAAVGVFSTHMFSASMAQYWGASHVRGACVYTPILPEIGPGILASVLHAGNQAIAANRDGFKGFPWVPESPGHGGFEADGRMPFERFLGAEKQLAHPANLVLPMIRAIRLRDPKALDGDHGLCDACGRNDMPLVIGFSLLPEPTIHARVAESTKADWQSFTGAPLQASGIFTKTNEAGTFHPSLAYVEVKAKEGEPPSLRPQMVDGGVDGFKSLRPGWVQWMNILKDTKQLPAALLQLSLAGKELRVKDRLRVNLFGVRFEGATNPNPKYILDSTHGVDCLLSAAKNETFADSVTKIMEAVSGSFDAWITAAQILDHDMKYEDEAWVRSVPGSKSRREQAREAVKHNPIFWSEAQTLWRLAANKLYGIAEITAMAIENGVSAELILGHVDTERTMAAREIKRATQTAWNRFLVTRASQDQSFQDTFLRAKADEAFRNALFGQQGKAKKAKAAAA